LISAAVGYTGTLAFDHTKPDGTMRKLMDVGLINDLGWIAKEELSGGLSLAYQDYIKTIS
jgi:GDP-L-fucose synthase